MKLTCTLSIVVILLFTNNAIAQSDTIFLKKEARLGSPITDRPPQAVFAELYGRSLLFSANYDRRFNKTTDGLGFSIGAGYFKIDEFSLFSVPITLNYLLGKNGKYFETGIGTTFFAGTVDDFGFGDSYGSSSGSTFAGTLTLGYRSQPMKGGFMFRAGLNPIFLKNVFVPYLPYVSFGYNF